MKLLDPDNKLIDHKIYRGKCILKREGYIKDLKIFLNRDIRNMVIIDNLILSFTEQLDNGIHIPTFKGNKNDTEFLKLIPLMIGLSKVDDI